jgi:hypothetical protein
MNDNRDASSRQHVVAALRELIKALDRRVPHIERLGEERIATEAMELRIDAARRIEELTAESDRNIDESALSDAVMTDDGAPSQQRR